MTEEQRIEAALALLDRSTLFIQSKLDLYPGIKVTFTIGNSIETIQYSWDGERFIEG